MYTLIRQTEMRQRLLTEASSMTFAMVIAELFFKFHSFTLECLAFLATWYALSWLATQTRRARPSESDRRV